MSRPLFLTLAVVALLAQPATAQHSDVEFEYHNNQIDFHSGEPSGLDAAVLFEGEFPVGGPSGNFTSDPGFASEVSEGLGVNPGDQIWINFIVSPSLGGFLQYHDGTDFASTTANILVADNSPGSIDPMIFEGSVSGDNPVFLQTADGIGDIHSHVDFTLSAGADQGAYALLMQLQTSAPGISDSDPFWFIFNHGLDEDTFENVVVPAFQSSAIPEPGTLGLIGIAALAITCRRRRSA